MVIKNWKIQQSFVFGALCLVLLAFIAFVEKKGAERGFHSLEVNVKGISDVYFVEEQEVIRMLQKEFPEMSTGEKLETIPLRKLEEKVEQHPFVKNAEVFNDLKGKVRVEIEQYRPLARIARPLAADGYISEEGVILPTSPHYTSRVLIVEGALAGELLAEKNLYEQHEDLMGLIRFIDRSEFWRAQIATVEVDKNKDVKLFQQVGRQVIEMGKPVDIADKFQKINLFYEEIIPEKGWDAYTRVNVEFKDQIICE